jgi:glycerophosphoryl diester phosphodiesterase
MSLMSSVEIVAHRGAAYNYADNTHYSQGSQGNP